MEELPHIRRRRFSRLEVPRKSLVHTVKVRLLVEFEVAVVRCLDVRIVTDGGDRVREARFECDGQPVFGKLGDASFLFNREWDLLRVTRRGVGEPADWFSCSVCGRALVLRIR